MYPELLHIGSFTLRSYSLITEIGIIVGVYAGYRAARRQGVPADTFIDLAIWAVLLGIVGSRAYYVVVNWNLEHYAEEPLRVFASWEGGLIFQGAIVGGILGLLLGIRRTGLPFLQVTDWGALGLVLGHAVGRWACFFNGCCYGTTTDLPWGVRFPYHDLPVQPTMIYESLANFVIFAILWQVEQRKPVHGYTLSLYMILYSTVRFLDEFTRGDPADMLLNLRLAQVVSLGTLALGLALFVYVRRQARERETRWAGLPAPADSSPERQ
ncbi:MAG: prolipoprotein diacylglyceryl transferase [Chloroflexi bacterium]|nr:prolipoprotein diacylglyceryl transferase [Chloroflexota bacterium]MCL5107679.1 prolipoprotein diacylglyceryl transferase [Chloroflexota bacterium]